MRCRTLLVPTLLFTIAPCAAAQSAAQSVNVLEFAPATPDQNWTRSSYQLTLVQVTALAFAKAHGETAEEFGRWNGNLLAPVWGEPNSGSAIRIARAIQNNSHNIRGTTVEVVNAHDTVVTLRIARPYTAWFTGPGRTWYGVTVDEYERVNRELYEEMARRVGLHVDYRVDGDWVTLSLTGRGADAVLEFPKGTYRLTLTAQDVPGGAAMAGTWESTYESDGTFSVRHNGTVAVEGTYELWLDQIVFRSERGVMACPGTGKYSWTANKATGNVTISRLTDNCDARVRYLTRRAFSRK